MPLLDVALRALRNRERHFADQDLAAIYELAVRPKA